jgi:hypothetical protein
MADARDFFVTDSAGAPLLGAAGGMSAIARDVTGATRTAPAVTEVGDGMYQVLPTDADETAGTLVLVDCGAGSEPRRVSIECFKGDNSNQFFGLHVENTAGALWTGAAPTVGSYRDATGAARTAPTLVAVAGAYLYVSVPSAADVTADTSIRVDGPAGSAQPYWYDDTAPLVESGGPVDVAPSPGLGPDALSVVALREYLLRYLPAKVAQLNGLRAATLRSALAEPFTVPAGAVLRLSSTSQEQAPTDVPLTSGTRTAAQVATDIGALVPGLTASADEAGRLLLTSSSTPAPGAPSVVVVARDAGNTGSNAAFGWSDGGEHYETAALTAPSWRGVVDGRPLTVPDMGQGFWLMLGNRTVRPTHPGIRRDTHTVAFACEVWRPFSANAPPHRSREAISSCVRAVKELLEGGDGRYLGRQGAGDVQLVTVTDTTINGEPLTLTDSPGILFDIARLTINVRVFQRPD